MSVLSSVLVTSPFAKNEECARLVIEDARERYTFYDVMIAGFEYTLSFWVRSEAAGELIFLDKTVQTTTEWSRVVHTFTGNDISLVLNFGAAGTYYIYHAQLELGNVPTDWSLSPEDIELIAKDAHAAANDAQSSADEAGGRLDIAESIIKQLADQISMLVTDGNGMSLMTQTKDGWTFSVASLQNAVNNANSGLNTLNSQFGDTKKTVEVLQGAVKDLEEISEYVKIGVYEDEPCIELGEGDSDFKLLITNTRIMFMEGGNVPTYISNDGLITDNIQVNHELRQGNFVWAVRANGNYGLMRKG